MTRVRLAERESTVLWAGDGVVVCASLAGIAAAMELASRGKTVCLVEPGPTLGTEISAQWQTDLPVHPLSDRVRALCRELGIHGETVDILTATLSLDRITEEAGIDALPGVRATRVLADASGRIQGVEVVGKSGRQLVQAAVVADASPGQAFSRHALGRPAPEPATAERRSYVHGADVTAPLEIDVPADLGCAENRVRLLPAAWPGEALLSLSVAADGHTEERLTDQTYLLTTRLFEHLRRAHSLFSDAVLVDIAPACRFSYRTGDAAGTPTGALVILPWIETLSERVDAARDAASRLDGVPPSGSVSLPAPAPDTDCLVTSELGASPEWDLQPAPLAEVDAQLHEPVDVVVAGWGTAGCLAALAAADEGAAVAALDPSSIPGGIGTAGRIHNYYHGRTGGKQDLLDERAAGRAANLASEVRGYYPVGKAEVLLDQLREHHVQRHAGHTVFGVIRRGATVEGVVSAARDGYHVFPCKVAIDSTGDGDVCAAAGAAFRLGREGDGFPQPYSYTPTRVQNGVLNHHNFDAGWVDPTDTLDLARAYFEGRSRIRALAPFSCDRHYCTLASVLGIRESRFVVGPVTLTFPDLMAGRRYPDTVCDAYAHYDNHAVDYAEESEWAMRHVVMFGLWSLLCAGEVPYRALLPDGINGMLVGCRALSVDHDMHQLLRMQRDLQKIGEICGTAAAMAAARIISPSDLDPNDLLRRLQQKGIAPTAPAQSLAGRHVSDELARLGSAENGLAMWRLSRLPAHDPAWERYFAATEDPDRRFCAAVAAALAGVESNAVRDELRRAVADRVDEPRLGRKSPPRYVVALMALADLGDEFVTRRIGEVLLHDALAPQDAVLLLKALGDAGDPAGVAILRDVLAREEDSAVPMWGCPDDLRTSFRFRIESQVIRSLHALGCRDEDERLQPYLDDPRLLVRRYARRLHAGRP